MRSERVSIGSAAAVAALSLLWTARPAAGEAQPPDPRADLSTITVEAERDRAVMEHQVKTFVSAIAVAPFQESLARWRTPVCPLVAGLPRDHGEFILERISRIVEAAGAPLAKEQCRGNFYVIVTADPEALLNAWRKRNTNIFGDEGGTKIRHFLHASGPIRVWYNANVEAADGSPLTVDSQAMTASGLSNGSGSAFAGIPNNTHALGFRLEHDEVRDLSSVIVMVDSRRAKGVSFGQLADYVAMVGLAEVRLDANVGDAPTILHLFSSSGNAAAPGLSAWDQAFLKALYHTEQTDKAQLSAIKVAVIKQIAP